jgi:hypothetical protein
LLRAAPAVALQLLAHHLLQLLHSRTRMNSHNGTLRPFWTCPHPLLIYARTRKLLMRRTCKL